MGSFYCSKLELKLGLKLKLELWHSVRGYFRNHFIYKRNLMTMCLHHHNIEFCSTTSSLSSIKLFFVYKEQVTRLRETFETKWVQSTIHCQICRIFQTMWILNAVDIGYSDILDIAVIIWPKIRVPRIIIISNIYCIVLKIYWH